MVVLSSKNPFLADIEVAQQHAPPVSNPAVSDNAPHTSANAGALNYTTTTPPTTSRAMQSPSPPPFMDDEPPAYTPRPDDRHGEHTIEVGPSRPFQPPQHAPYSQPYYQPPGGGLSSLSRRPTGRSGNFIERLSDGLSSGLDRAAAQINQALNSSGSQANGWSSYPGQSQRYPPQSQYAPPPGAPPRPSSTPPTLPPRPSSPSATSSISDFARDFYAAGTAQAQPQSGQYATPTGPPPPPSLNRPPNDGRPTKTPTPGHPLLREGKILVYPANYECDKCRNTGFKHNDPLHPCKKCWNKYAKPFTGALQYTPWDSSSSSSSRGTTFQRPLPMFTPPHLSTPPVPPVPRPGSFPSVPPVPSIPGVPHPPPLPPRVNVQFLSPYARPPAGAMVYQAGDPRLGGRLCYRCEGRGLVTFMLFDESQCPECRGTGRIFT